MQAEGGGYTFPAWMGWRVPAASGYPRRDKNEYGTDINLYHPKEYFNKTA
jgi:hypothetical protein